MQSPEQIEFDGLTIPATALLRNNRKHVGPVRTDWIRTSFEIPDGYSAPRKIEEWLEENCQNQWASFHYANVRSKDHCHIMVVRFEDRNDAMFFKLRDGHKAWENT